MKKSRNKILFANIVVLSLVLTSFPMVTGENLPVFSENVLVEGKRASANMDKLIDNVEIECVGLISFLDLLLAILNNPVYYIRIRISNSNDKAINIKQHITLTAIDGRVLDDFDDDISHPIPREYRVTTLYFTRYDWQDFDYMWGRFNITLEFRILEDASGLKLVFHGFIFNIGAIIFNPKGEVLDTYP